MSTPTRPAKPAKRRGEGQWALGYREPLNANEQSKKDDNPLNVRARIENIYAKQGFDSIDKGDLRGRFRWWGLYTQREQGYDGSWTGDENTDLLEAKYFMMRVRSDAGALSHAALRTLGELSTEFARDTADISDRRERAVPLDPDRGHAPDLEAAGRRRPADHRGVRRLPARGARLAAGRRVAGRGARRHAAVEEIVRRYIGKPEYSNLPRKYKTAISGLQDVVHEVNDVAFIGVNHPEHGPGLDLWVGGGLSTNPMLGQRVGAWVPLDEVPDVWEAVTSVFRDYGYRRLRSKARLKFLIKDWGIEKFRRVLETEYLKRKLIDGPAPEPAEPPDRPRRRAEAEERAQRRRRRADRGPGVGHHPDQGRRPRRGGRVGPHPLHPLPEADHPRRARRQARRAARRAGRAGPARPAVAVAAQSDGLHAASSTANCRSPRRGCARSVWCPSWSAGWRTSTPSSTCRSPSTSTAARTRVRESRSPTSGSRVRWSTTARAGTVEGFQVHLGGSLGLDSGFGRKLRQHKVTSDELGDYIERVVRNFVKQREHGERFATWAMRADEADLR